MTTDYRAMCAELVDSVELLLEMRAVDAKPMAITEDRLTRARALLAGFDRANIKAAGAIRIILDRHAVNHARAVLAKWGHRP